MSTYEAVVTMISFTSLIVNIVYVIVFIMTKNK